MKLNQKLAEWVGFKVEQVKVQGLPDVLVHTPEGKEYVGDAPDFTASLDACFQHLVPENAVVQFLPVSDGLCCIICYAGEWYSGKADKKQYALALCKAMEKILDAPDNT